MKEYEFRFCLYSNGVVPCAEGGMSYQGPVAVCQDCQNMTPVVDRQGPIWCSNPECPSNKKKEPEPREPWSPRYDDARYALGRLDDDELLRLLDEVVTDDQKAELGERWFDIDR